MKPEFTDLGKLVGFPTVSQDSNLKLLDWVEALLAPLGPRIRSFPSPDGAKANLLVSVGPEVPGGLVLSGHIAPSCGRLRV